MGKDRGGIWGKNESKKGSGAKKGPPGAGDDDDTPKMGKKEAYMGAVVQVLREKHVDACEMGTQYAAGDLPLAIQQHTLPSSTAIHPAHRTPRLLLLARL